MWRQGKKTTPQSEQFRQNNSNNIIFLKNINNKTSCRAICAGYRANSRAGEHVSSLTLVPVANTWVRPHASVTKMNPKVPADYLSYPSRYH